MRLPTWFTAGVMVQETAGFTPAKIKDRQLWTLPTGHVAPAAISLSRPLTDLPAGQDVALAVAISADLTADVRQHLASTGRDIPLLTVLPSTGTSNTSITGLDHAFGLALAIRDLAREIAAPSNPRFYISSSPHPPDLPSSSAESGTESPPPKPTKTSPPTDTNQPSASPTKPAVALAIPKIHLNRLPAGRTITT